MEPRSAPLELAPPPLAPVRERWLLHGILFVATFASVAGLQWVLTQSWREGLLFAGTLLAILTCHELGHYFMGRWYGVSISPPYFIPLPLPIGPGTLGAVIQIRSPFPTRNSMVDIGAAGPIAGMVVAVPLLLWGTAHSHYDAVKYVAGDHLPGRFSLWAMGHALWAGWNGAQGPPGLELLAARLTGAGHGLGALFDGQPWSGDSLITWLAQELTLGPRPAGTDLYLHPVANAAWFGCLVTMLNLFPIGQLDGGHVTAALFGKRAEWVGQAVHLAMLGLMVYASAFWVVWLLFSRRVVGLSHPPPMDEKTPVSPLRYGIALLALVLLVLTFLPVVSESRGPA